MATTSTHASGQHRRLWFLIAAAAVAVLALVLVLHSVRSDPKSVEQRIGEQVYADSCLTRVSTNERVVRR